MKNTFKKEERLCSKLLIDNLFHDGSSFVVYPFRVVYLGVDTRLPKGIQVMLSVSKKRFKHAHQRNKIKRKMREAFRLQKAELLYPTLERTSSNILLAIQYIAKEDVPYQQYDSRMSKVLSSLVHEISS